MGMGWLGSDGGRVARMASDEAGDEARARRSRTYCTTSLARSITSCGMVTPIFAAAPGLT